MSVLPRRLMKPVFSIRPFLLVGLLACCAAQSAVWLRVERVVDGDTVILERLGRARLLGIDTPESVRPGHPVENFGKEAARFLRQLLEDREVRVRFDEPRVDDHGRDLVFLFLRDGTFVNARLLEEGMAFLFVHSENRYRREFEELERQARAAGKGIWSMTGNSVIFTGNEQSFVYHAPGCEHYRCRQCTSRFRSIPAAEEAGYRMHRACVTQFLRRYRR